MTERIVPFNNLSEKEAQLLIEKGINWRVQTPDRGYKLNFWSEVIDPRYGSTQHLAIIDEEKGIAYDKRDDQWQPAVFVTVFRQNDGKTEYLIPSEKRILLKDDDGNRGNVYLRNIPQGLVKTWQNETEEQAAIREVKEETGLEPKRLIKLTDVYHDAANSSTAMPYFLAEVDSDQTFSDQNLDETEDIIVGEDDWFSEDDIEDLKLQCAKTMTGLFLTARYLKLEEKLQGE